MRVEISTSGYSAAKLEPADEKKIREVLMDDYPGDELAYYLDHLVSDVDLFTDIVVEEDDGTVLFEGSL